MTNTPNQPRECCKKCSDWGSDEARYCMIVNCHTSPSEKNILTNITPEELKTLREGGAIITEVASSEQTNYVDSRTPEEREADSKVQVSMTTTTVFPSPLVTEGWEKMFEEEYPEGFLRIVGSGNDYPASKDIKKFIKEVVISQTRNSVLEEVSGVLPKDEKHTEEAYVRGFNMALSLSREAISKLLK